MAEKKKNEKVIIKLTPDNFQIQQSSQSSVEIRRGPKGTTEFTVKSYGDTTEAASKAALETYNKLMKDLKVKDEE